MSIRQPQRAAAVALLLSMMAFPAAAAAQDDAGTGGDAPDRSDQGPHLPLGVHNGTLAYDEGDLEDWYRVSVPNGSLRLSFFATHGGLWGGIYREEDGSYVTNAYSTGNGVTLDSGGPGTFRIGFGDQNGFGAAGYVFEARASFDVPPPSHDGPCFGDVPAGAACHVRRAGTYGGSLDPAAGDASDAFVIDIWAPSMTLRVEGDGVGAVLNGVHLATPFEVEVDDAKARLVLQATTGAPASYVFAVSLPPLPDAAVAAVTAEPETRQYVVGEMESGTHVIRVVVENRGDAVAEVGGAVNVRTQVGSTHIPLSPRTLEPGGQTTYEVRWSTERHVGRYTAEAYVRTPYDVDPTNDWASASEWVLVRAPVGV